VLEVAVSIKQRKIPYLLSLNSIVTESRKTLIAGVAHNLSEQIQQRRAIQSAYDELSAVHRQLEELNASLERKVVERTANLMEAYRQLEEQNKVLQGLDQLKSDFVSMVSHELRNPLNNLGGGLELLLARPKNGRQNSYVDIDAGRSQKTDALCRIDPGCFCDRGRPARTAYRPRVARPIFEQLARNSGMPLEAERIQIQLQPDLPDVMAAQTALESVLRHLVDNAIKYAPDGPVIVSASLARWTGLHPCAGFWAWDPDDKKKLLFERFQRLDAKDSQSVYGYGWVCFCPNGFCMRWAAR
jgi:signal transduction histidine kinase